VFGGGFVTGPVTTIDYVTIASTGNATEFGNLTGVQRAELAACSNATAAVQPTPTSSAIALFGGGYNLTNFQTAIQYINIATTSNAYMFGDLTVARYELAGCGSSTRGVFGGGETSSGLNVIDYVEFSTFGKATDFGDLIGASVYYLGACSSSTRGLFGGGIGPTNVISYITIASTGNATDFGDLTVARLALAGCSSPTRGLFGGGDSGSATNVIDYVTIASTGNATDFGDLTVTMRYLASCSSSTRGIFGGGSGPINVISYVTIASAGNATDFGDLTVARDNLSGCSSTTRGVFAGGDAVGTYNVIDYITIASTGNATDFGDLSGGLYACGATSNAHGGL
jgi:hypothetical protein